MRWLLWCFCLLAESYETINHYSRFQFWILSRKSHKAIKQVEYVCCWKLKYKKHKISIACTVCWNNKQWWKLSSVKLSCVWFILMHLWCVYDLGVATFLHTTSSKLFMQKICFKRIFHRAWNYLWYLVRKRHLHPIFQRAGRAIITIIPRFYGVHVHNCFTKS